VKAKRFGAVFLSIFITATLMAPVMMLLSAGRVSAQPDYDIIVQGSSTCYNTNEAGPPPGREYGKGDMPPVMAAKKVGFGAVVAAGISRTCNGGIAYSPARWTSGELDVLLDKAFKWMVPGATKVLWYGKDKVGYMVYNDADHCSWLIDDLRAKGYKVDNTAVTPITSSLLDPYDILVIPQFQLGDGSIGGNPDLLPDDDVAAIVEFVENKGRGLFIMDGGDSTVFYCFHLVQNKILKALDFGVYFQHDSVVDDADTKPYVTVDVTESGFGKAYRDATGKTTVRLYRVNTLLMPAPGVVVEIAPTHQASLPGSTLTFSVSATNPDATEDNYVLTASDTRGWSLVLSEDRLRVPPSGKSETTLTVTIPSGAAVGTEDIITVKADSEVKPGVSHSKSCTVRAETQLVPPADDTYTHEGRPSMNFGAGVSMYVGWYAGGREKTWLKFDLSVLPAGTSIRKVKLWLFCHDITGWGSHGVKCHGVENDDWTEETITWDTQPPTIGALLDGPKPVTETGWYFWDVSGFVQQEFTGDKKMSLCLLDNEEHIAEDHSPWFRTKEADVELWPYLEFVPSYKMDMSVSPPWTQDNSPGGTLTYTITVNNLGMNEDTYSLTAGSARGWGVAIMPDSLTVPPDESRTARLTVTIPGGASPSTKDTITVTATGTGVSKSATCRAHAFEGARLLPIADAYVSEGFPEVMYGREDNLYLQSSTTGAKNQRIFLKFDLSAIPSDSTIIDAEVWLWSRKAEFADINAQCRMVPGDAFVDEDLITWGTRPLERDVLSTVALRYLPPSSDDMWIAWSVTSFAESQFMGDKMASFCIMAEREGASGRYTFSSKEWQGENERPHLKVTYTAGLLRGVRVSISPGDQSGMPGSSLSYTVTVRNLGLTADSYNLTVRDNAGWSPSVSPTSLTVPAGENRTATLSVTIPEDAPENTRNSITVIATSTTENAVSDSASCIAHAVGAPPGRVQVTISPESQSGNPGEVLNFSVTVRNTGENRDTFNLVATDTKGWDPTLSITSTTLDGGAPRTIRLSIKIPDNAAEGDSTTITVTARGTGYENSATCTAEAAAGGISPLVYVGAAVVVVVIIAAVLIVKPF